MKEVFSSDVCYLAAADEGERELLTIFGKNFPVGWQRGAVGQFDNKGLWDKLKIDWSLEEKGKPIYPEKLQPDFFG